MKTFRKLRSWFAERRLVVETRRHLARLSDRELEDIGVNRDDALEESRKPFWRS